MTSKRITIDLLSSSSDDEKPVAERHALEDTSDEDGGFQTLPTKRNICSSIENISSSLRKIKIGKSHSPTKGVCTTKLDMSQVGLSSDDDDSIIERYGRLKSRKKITTEDFGEHASSGRLKTVVKNTGTDQAGRSRPGAGKAQGRWRLSISRGEYTVSDVSNPNLPNFRIPSTLFDRLYNHQKEGVAWMIGLHAEGVGGLLGDDMGMGKTYQTLTFLGGMMRARTIRNALIVAPVSVLRSWEKEANTVVKMCVSNVCINVISSDIAKRTRKRLLRSALECPSNRPNLIISTYGLIQSSVDDFSHESFDWDYVVLDEAHKIKNPSTDVAKNIRLVARGDETRRVILTGTPIMNNLRELWALFDFVTSGKLLGPATSFSTRYQRPIEEARNKDATKFQIEAGNKANLDLQEKLKPYLLQRLKVDFMADHLPTKSDFVVWTHLSKRQRDLYSEYVQAKDSAVADVLSGVKSSPLEAITWLKKLCGHPILVSKKTEAPHLHDPLELKRHSVKLQVLDALVQQLRTQGHRMLIFSQSTKMLDIIQSVLQERVQGMSRIDGSTKERDRQRLVDLFNEKGSLTEVMLLSTGAGGIGLTLTGADRAIIYDPSWNPAEDSQAVDRCYRIGQEKDVSVFRLIAAGTVEEKMYEKQVHKDGIRRAVVTNMGSALARYFDKQDLKQIFKLNPPGQCDFLDRLGEKGCTRDSDIFHRGVIGISSHDVLYTEDADITTENSDLQVGVNSQDNPFSSPTKAAHLTLHEVAGLESTKGIVRALGKSQRVMNKESMKKVNDLIPLRKLGDQTNNKTIRQAKSNIKENRSNQSIKKNIQDFLIAADRLSASGRREDAMEILMDAMDALYNDLDKVQKKQLHLRMSSIAYELRWL